MSPWWHIIWIIFRLWEINLTLGDSVRSSAVILVKSLSLCGPSNEYPFNNIMAALVSRVMTDLLVVAFFMRFNCGLGMGGVGTLLVMDPTGYAADK